MSSRHVLNYTTLQFCPYPETGEFVNIGVVGCCGEIDFFNYLIDTKHAKRVTQFFPELSRNIFTEGRKHINKVLDDIYQHVIEDNRTLHPSLPGFSSTAEAAFKHLIKPKESIFRFSSPATSLTENPEESLKQLFHDIVYRRFAEPKEYQETIMNERLKNIFRRTHILDKFRTNEKVGPEEYKVVFPFVRQAASNKQISGAIRPLSLQQKEPTGIFEHGDKWISRINRLSSYRCLPSQLLMVISYPDPSDKKRWTAAQDITEELRKNNHITVKQFHKMDEVIETAKIIAAC